MITKYSKERNSKLLNIFLIISLLFATLGIINYLSEIFLGKYLINLNLKLDGIVRILIFIFSIYCLIQFRKQKLSKLTYILPIWTISVLILSIIFGIILVLLYLNFSISPEIILESQLFNLINFMLNLAYFIITLHLIYLFKR